MLLRVKSIHFTLMILLLTAFFTNFTQTSLIEAQEEPPNPRVYDFYAPINALPGNTISIRVCGVNEGGRADEGDLHIILPDLPDEFANSNYFWIRSSSGLSGSKILWPGDTTGGANYGGPGVVVDYPIAVGWRAPWGRGETACLEVGVKIPDGYVKNSFRIFYKMTIGNYGKKWYGDPKEDGSESNVKDQQNEYVWTYTISITTIGNLQVQCLDVNGNPVPNVEVKLYKSEPWTYLRSQRADSNGRTTFTDLPQDLYYVTYVPLTPWRIRDVGIMEVGTGKQSVRVEAGKTVSWTVREAGLTVYVRDQAGNPIQGVGVLLYIMEQNTRQRFLENSEKITDSDGKVVYRYLAPNSYYWNAYVVEVYKDGKFVGSAVKEIGAGWNSITVPVTMPVEVDYVSGKFKADGIEGKQIYVLLGTDVSIYITLGSSGEVTGNLKVEVKKAIIGLPDQVEKTFEKTVTVKGQTEILVGTFNAKELTAGETIGNLLHYYYKVYWNGKAIYDPTDPKTREWVETTKLLIEPFQLSFSLEPGTLQLQSVTIKNEGDFVVQIMPVTKYLEPWMWTLGYLDVPPKSSKQLPIVIAIPPGTSKGTHSGYVDVFVFLGGQTIGSKVGTIDISLQIVGGGSQIPIEIPKTVNGKSLAEIVEVYKRAGESWRLFVAISPLETYYIAIYSYGDTVTGSLVINARGKVLSSSETPSSIFTTPAFILKNPFFDTSGWKLKDYLSIAQRRAYSYSTWNDIVNILDRAIVTEDARLAAEGLAKLAGMGLATVLPIPEPFSKLMAIYSFIDWIAKGMRTSGILHALHIARDTANSLMHTSSESASYWLHTSPVGAYLDSTEKLLADESPEIRFIDDGIKLLDNIKTWAELGGADKATIDSLTGSINELRKLRNEIASRLSNSREFTEKLRLMQREPVELTMDIQPRTWDDSVEAGKSKSQTFTVSASGGIVKGVTVNKISGPDWLTISPTSLGDIPAGSPKTFIVTASPPAGTIGSFDYLIRVSCTEGEPRSIDISGTITVTPATPVKLVIKVHNHHGLPMPREGGSIFAYLYTRDLSKADSKIIKYSGGEEHVMLEFSVTPGDYIVFIENAPNRGLRLLEYWGEMSVSAPGIYDFYRHTQVIDEVKVDKNTVTLGDSVEINVKVRNLEESYRRRVLEYIGTRVKLILDRDRAEPWDYVAYFPIAPPSIRIPYDGGVENFLFKYAPKDPGTYYLYALSEGNYYNVKGEAVFEGTDQYGWVEAFTVQTQIKPDLTVEKIEIVVYGKPAGSNPQEGDSVEFIVTIKNIGGSAAPSGWYVDYYLDGEFKKRDRSAITVGAGASVVSSYSWKAPEGSAGKHTLKVVVDPTNIVDEGNEANNEKLIEFIVEPGAPPPLPDLTIIPPIPFPPVEPLIIPPGSAPPITIVEKNVGGADAGMHTDRVTVTITTTEGVILQRIEEERRHSLKAGESSPLPLPRIPSLPPGKYKVKINIALDVLNEVKESKEDNNVWEGVIVVEVPPQPTVLSVDVWTNKGGQGRGNINGGQYSIGESITLYCSVNTNVDALRIKVIRPDGVELIVLERGSLPAGTYQASGTAGEPIGERRVICEARSGGQTSSDEVRFTVTAPSGVEVRASNVRLSVSENGSSRIILSEAPSGLAGYEIIVRLVSQSGAQQDIADIIDVRFPEWADLKEKSINDDEARLRAVDMRDIVRAGAREIILAEVIIKAKAEGTMRIELNIVGIDDDEGKSISAITRDGVLEVVQVSGPPPLEENLPPPRDLDGDGLYEDINGNGRLDFDDVVKFFEHFDDLVISQYSRYYDFNRNGRLDYDDIIELFERL